MERRSLTGLGAVSFQHDMDRVLLDKLNKMPGLPALTGWLIDHLTKEMEYEFTGGGAFAVSKTSLPELWQVYEETCKALDLRDSPSLYVVPGSDVNAYTTGVDRAVVCLTNMAVNTCTNDELRFILGHELGHCMCSHVKFHNLARYISEGVKLSVRGVAAAAISPLLLKWSRCSEISADRAGLLACQDFEACCAAFLKLGGFPRTRQMPESPSEVLSAQVELNQRKYGEFGLARRLWKETTFACSATHPRIVERFACLREWLDMGCFDELVDSTCEERRRMAAAVTKDVQRHELLMQMAVMASDFLSKRLGVPKREILSPIRKAFLSGISLKGTAAEQLLMADLVVKKISNAELRYELQLYIQKKDGKAVRVTLEVPFEPEWEFAPKAFREKFIRDRTDELKVGLYQVGEK